MDCLPVGNCAGCTGDKNCTGPCCKGRDDLTEPSMEIAAQMEFRLTQDASESSTSSSSSIPDEKPIISVVRPLSKTNLIRVATMGVASAAPWWILFMAIPLWTDKFGNGSSGPFKKPTGAAESQALAIMLSVSMLALMVASITNCLLTTKTSRKSRLYPAAAGSIISLIIFTVFIKVDTSKWTVGFYAMTMVFVIIYKSSMGFQNTLGTFLGHFPTVYLNKFVQGQAFAGVIISVLYILGVHFLKGDNGSQAMVLFTAGIMLSLISALMYYQLRRTNCTQEFWKVNTSNQNSSARYKSIAIDTARVIKGMKHEAIALTIVFTSTVAIFPSITKKAKSSASLAGDLYVPIFCFLFFSFFDWVGRVFATGCNKFINRDWAVIPSSTMRTVFMSLLILCKRSDNTGVWIFANDATFIVLMALFGLTQGYIVGAIFDRLPKVTAEGDREVAVAALLMFIHIGMMLGTALSYGIDAIIPHS